MYRGTSVAVVVMAYDEVGHIDEVLDSLPAFVDRVYAVDDGSTDGTWRVLREHADLRLREGEDPMPSLPGAHDPGGTPYTTLEGYRKSAGGPPGESPRVVAVRHAENRGVGGAVKTGYRLALADEMEVVVAVSGDGQMDPAYLDRMIDPIVDGRADFTKGTRFSLPEHSAGMPSFRRFGNYLLTSLTRVSTGYWHVQDSQNGYTAISRSTLEAIQFEDLYDGYGFLNDQLAALSRAGMRVVDVPHPAKYGDEDSTIQYRSFVPQLSVLLLSNFLTRLRRTARTNPFDPALVGYLLGMTCVVAAVVASAAAVAGVTVGTPSAPWTVPVALGIGVVCGVAGFLADARMGSGPTRVPHQPRNLGKGGGKR